MRERRRALMERQAQGAPAYGRVFPVLQIVHELVLLGKTASQRDVYYRHASLHVICCASTSMMLRRFPSSVATHLHATKQQEP